MLSINVSYSVEFGLDAQARWNREHFTFFNKHKNKDTNYSDLSYKNVGKEPATNWSCFVDNTDGAPWFFHKCITFLLYLVCLGWIPKYHFDKNIYECEFEIKKYVEK